MAKKKPNYKLRRNLAKTFLVLIIIIPIVLINRVKLAHLPLYLSNTKYTDVIDAVEVFVDRYHTNQFIKEMKELDEKEGYDYAYFIKTFEL